MYLVDTRHAKTQEVGEGARGRRLESRFYWLLMRRVAVLAAGGLGGALYASGGLDADGLSGVVRSGRALGTAAVVAVDYKTTWFWEPELDAEGTAALHQRNARSHAGPHAFFPKACSATRALMVPE